MLDVVCVLGVIALFALVAVVGRAVDKLGPGTEPTAQRTATRGQARE